MALFFLRYVMELLKVFDDNDYDNCSIEHKRMAVRAIIMKEGKLAFTVSSKEGFYKFPGGGINENENPIDALVRETQEETGLQLDKNTIKEFGMTIEKRKDKFTEDAVFIQTSLYYFCNLKTDSLLSLNLDDYEKELGFHLEWETIEKAYLKDKSFGNGTIYDYIIRETYILDLLRKQK